MTRQRLVAIVPQRLKILHSATTASVSTELDCGGTLILALGGLIQNRRV